MASFDTGERAGVDRGRVRVYGALVTHDGRNGMRYAVVTAARDADEVRAYLPDNYSVLASRFIGLGGGNPHTLDRQEILIGGQDHAGWTLDGYIIPRLASGLIQAHEINATTAGDFATEEAHT